MLTDRFNSVHCKWSKNESQRKKFKEGERKELEDRSTYRSIIISNNWLYIMNILHRFGQLNESVHNATYRVKRSDNQIFGIIVIYQI